MECSYEAFHSHSSSHSHSNSTQHQLKSLLLEKEKELNQVQHQNENRVSLPTSFVLPKRKGRKQVSHLKEALSHPKEALSHPKEALSHPKNAFHNQKDAFANVKDNAVRNQKENSVSLPKAFVLPKRKVRNQVTNRKKNNGNNGKIGNYRSARINQNRPIQNRPILRSPDVRLDSYRVSDIVLTAMERNQQLPSRVREEYHQVFTDKTFLDDIFHRLVVDTGSQEAKRVYKVMEECATELYETIYHLLQPQGIRPSVHSTLVAACLLISIKLMGAYDWIYDKRLLSAIVQKFNLTDKTLLTVMERDILERTDWKACIRTTELKRLYDAANQPMSLNDQHQRASLNNQQRENIRFVRHFTKKQSAGRMRKTR
jgi:hypothetical protein